MSRDSLKSVIRLIDAANDTESVEEQFLHDLCRSIEMNASKSNRKPSQTFKPSSMNCKRNSYYQIVGADTDDSSGTTHTSIGIVNSGTDTHIRIQDAIAHMQDNGMDCRYVDVGDFVFGRNLEDIVVREKNGPETKLYNKKYNISFMCDGIIEYKGKYYILEIKTETSNKWYSRTGVDKKHYNQAITYSLSLGLNKVIFLYIDRDMSNKKAYMFDVTDEMRHGIIDYIADVDGYVERNIVPPKEDIPKNICNYCGYQTQCRKDK